MQVSVESGEGLHRRIHVELPGTEIEREIEAKLKALARTVRLHGFRPGKVPPRMIRQRFLGQATDEVLNEKIKDSLVEAVKQVGLVLADSPKIEPRVDLETSRYAYTAVVEVMPDIALTDLSDAVIERPVVTITEADLANMIEKLRHQQSTWQVVARPAATGDQVRISLAATVEGDSQNSHEAREFRVLLGSGILVDDLEAKLAGVVAGESFTLDSRIPENHPVVSVRGKPIRYEVQIVEVSEPVLPAVDAAFARKLGIGSGDVTSLEQDVRTNMARELAQRVKDKVQAQVRNALLDRHTFHVPTGLLRTEIEGLRKQFQQEASNAGKTLNPDDSFFEASARRRVQLGLLVSKIASKHDIKTHPTMVRAYIEALAASYEDPKQVVQHYYKTPELLQSVEWAVLEDQVTEWALARMKVQEKPMSFDHLVEGGQQSVNR